MYFVDIFPKYVADFERAVIDARYGMASEFPGLEEPIDYYRLASIDPRLIIGETTQVSEVLDPLSTAHMSEIFDLSDYFGPIDKLLALLALRHYTAPSFS